MTGREKKLNLLKEKFGPAILRADLPAENRLFVIFRRPIGFERNLQPSVPRARRPVHHRDRCGRPALLRQKFRFSRFCVRSGRIVDTASSPIFRKTIRGWTASPISFPPPTGRSASSGISSASSPSATFTRNGSFFPMAGRTAFTRSARTSPGIMCPMATTPTASLLSMSRPKAAWWFPFGPFHPTLDEPAHFRLYVEGEMVRGCEYRGFMVHRGIEKFAEWVHLQRHSR